MIRKRKECKKGKNKHHRILLQHSIVVFYLWLIIVLLSKFQDIFLELCKGNKSYLNTTSPIMSIIIPRISAMATISTIDIPELDNNNSASSLIEECVDFDYEYICN